jgi:hypothetical protein
MPHRQVDEAIAEEAVDPATLLAENEALRDRLLRALAEAENTRRLTFVAIFGGGAIHSRGPARISSGHRCNSSHPENPAVACLDFLSLRLHRRWIGFHQLDRGQRRTFRCYLHHRVERAQSGGID